MEWLVKPAHDLCITLTALSALSAFGHSVAWRLARATALTALAALSAFAPSPVSAQTQADVQALVTELVPYAERATGYSFKHPPRAGLQTREEARDYLESRLTRMYTPERLHAMATAYHLIGLLPDTTGFGGMITGVMAEQVLGYYDPASDSLFAVRPADPVRLREVMLHELVHALQGQYVSLDSLIDPARSNDARLTASGIAEGQATFATLLSLIPRRNVAADPELWSLIVTSVRRNGLSKPAMRDAPIWIREGMMAPYMYGAQFMNSWMASPLGDSLAFSSAMPVSTEQLLHFDRLLEGDEPLDVRFTGDTTDVLADDNVGELEMHMLLAQLTRRRSLPEDPFPLGWGGDRYRLYQTDEGPALIWYVVWDEAVDRDRFHAAIESHLPEPAEGYRVQLGRGSVEDRAATRFIHAPDGWSGWTAPPLVSITQTGD